MASNEKVGKIVRVAGVTFEGRQAKIKALADTARIRLAPEPSNIHDPSAIKVLADNEHIGYLPRDLAQKVSESLDLYDYFATLDEIIPGNDNPKNKKSWGVRIRLMRRKKIKLGGSHVKKSVG